MKYWGIFVFIVLLTCANSLCFDLAYAEKYGSVKDNNNGNEGDILIHSGNISGKSNDVGTWKNVKDVPGLKGDKGNKGEKGDTGNYPPDYLHNPFYEVDAELQLIRDKNYTLGIYTKQGSYQEYGLRIKIGIGKSWTEKELEKINKKLKKLERIFDKREIDAEVIKVDDHHYRIQLNDKDSAVKFMKKF